jgi:hypothetical protein
MKCPTCFSIMKCISEIHDVPGQPGKQRMDLHCYNRDNEKKPNRCRATCHMGVITQDPNPWECHDYSFQFAHDGKSYVLHSHDFSVDSYHQGLRSPETVLYSLGKTVIHMPCFIPISTGDDMHERAWELFHRLRKLIAFS